MKFNLGLRSAAAMLAAASLVCPAFADEGPVPKGIPHLDHVFLILMENHSYSQIVNNPNAPFTNKYAKSVNVATNYYAVAHPSLTNYLEIVGGSNFGVLNDNGPDWHNTTCVPNIQNATTGWDVDATPPVCPIWGKGTDAATPTIDYTNEIEPPAITAVTEIDGTLAIAAAPNTVGKTIGDQLAAVGLSWKSYQESLPISGADWVNNSDGYYTNNTDFSKILPAQNPPLTSADLVALYAVKHNPFAYFQSVQEGSDPRNSLRNIVPFDGPHGLYHDLGTGHAPTFSLIVPNQCNDQHGRGNAGALCAEDPNDDGTQNGLNPALIYRGDVALAQIVDAIHKSDAWTDHRSAIVIVWDENDYSAAPNANQVLLTVETNYGVNNVKSGRFYTHFSLLKTMEAGFHLPCLNHACDASVDVMSELFAEASH